MPILKWLLGLPGRILGLKTCEPTKSTWPVMLTTHRVRQSRNERAERAAAAAASPGTVPPRSP